MKSQGPLLFAVLFMCFVNRHSSLTQPDEEHTQTPFELQETVPEDKNAVIEKDSSALQQDYEASELIETPGLLATPSLSTTETWTTSEIAEQEITPTIAPATPNHDTGPTMPVSYSVVHDGNPGGAVEGPDELKSSVDSSPPVLVSHEPVPNPEPEEISETHTAEEESISSVLEQAQEQNKPAEEEMPSFDEFKRQKLKEEQEKIKQQTIQDTGGIPVKQKVKKTKKRKQTNYASVDCGAKVLEINQEASNAEAILTENRDVYMLNPCSAKIFFVVELCDTAHVKSIDIANFELFSSMPESFRVFVSSRYPTREWTMLGTFQATDQRDVQSFPLDEAIYAKYLKVEMLSHFGSEHYCPLSLLRVYGISMMEELEDQETDGQEEGEASEGDADEDDVPTLPPDPSAKQDELGKRGILEKAADTVISFVKKMVGGDGTGNSSDKDARANAQQQSIVTLIEPDEGDENSTDAQEPVAGRSEPQKKSESSSSKNDSESLPRTPAPTPCEVFVERLRHPSFGCVNGSIFICKKYQNWTVEPLLGRPGEFAAHKKKVPIVMKLDVSDEEDKQSVSGDRTVAKESRKRTKKKRKNKKERRVGYLKEQEVKAAQVSSEVENAKVGEVSEQQDEPSRVDATASVPVSAASAAQPSIPGKLPSVESNSSVQEQSTPSVVSATLVTTKPQPDISATSTTTSVAEESSVVESSGENAQDLSNSANQKPSGVEGGVLMRKEQHRESSSIESKISPSSVSSAQSEATSETSGSSVVSEASAPEDVQSAVHSSEGTGDKSVGTTVTSQATTVQSSCTAANSIELISPNSPHVDVLEIKLTDSGKEGTAELQQPDSDGLPGEERQNAPEGEGSGVFKPPQEKPSSEQKEMTNVEKRVDTSAVSQSTVAAASTEGSNLMEGEPPLPPPPVDDQDVDAPLLASVCRPDAAASPEVSSELASRAAQQASMSLGLGASGQKESVFMRLSNRIKALEQNLTLSTQYMEQIKQRYRKNLDELTKTFDKKIALLTDATKKAEVVINGQREQISLLQEQLDKTSSVVSELKQKMASINVEVMERHVIGLVLEVIFILVLMLMFRRCERLRVPLSPLPGAWPVQNGTGPPKDHHHGDDAYGKKTGDAREQPELQIVRAVSMPAGTDDHAKDSIAAGESKKKKHKRRSKCLEPALSPAVATDSSPQAPPSAITYTAGLLFSSARGILDSWMVKKPAGCQSESDIAFASNATGTTKTTFPLVRAKSLNGVEERGKDKPAPPPPSPAPPPRPPQTGSAKRVSTPPPQAISEGRRSSGCSGVHSQKKTGAQHPFFSFGKYGKQVKVG